MAISLDAASKRSTRYGVAHDGSSKATRTTRTDTPQTSTPQTGKTIKKATASQATDQTNDPSRPTSSLAPPRAREVGREFASPG